MNRIHESTAVVLGLLTLSAGPHPSRAEPPATGPSTSPSAAPTTSASTAPAAQEPDVRTFVVTPALPPVPALSYRFDYSRDQQYDGNGASTFLQALMNVPNDATLQPLEDAKDLVSDDEYVRAVRKNAPWLDTQMPHVLASAVRYRTCTFEWPVRDEGINVLLPYLNHTRALANYVQFRARLATATGDWRQSIELIRAMFILADFTDDGDSFLVNNLVSVGMGMLAIDEVHRLIERPEAPNLYWALRQVPAPFGNYRSALHNEQTPLALTFPALRRVNNGEELSAVEWRQVIRDMRKLQGSFTTRPFVEIADPDATDFGRADLAAAKIDYARRRHLSEADVNARDAMQVVSAYYYDCSRDALDEQTKWASVPYPQALPRIEAADVARTRLLELQPGNPFARLASFSMRRAVATNARFDRSIAATATVEALRAHAARTGRLPARLSDLADTPAPDNPATGRPFDYVLEDGAAVLSDPGQWLGRPLRYEVRLRK